MNKSRLLIIPAHIRSHVLPSLYLADRLSAFYEIEYVVSTDILRDLVQKNGYSAHLVSNYRVGLGLEGVFLQKENRANSFWHLCASYLKNEIFHFRRAELAALIAKTQAQVVVLDIFNSADVWVLHGLVPKIMFFNPMLSTYRVGNFPTVSAGGWHGGVVFEEVESKFQWSFLFRKPQYAILFWLRQQQKKALRKITQLPYKETDNSPICPTFSGIQEFVLAPLAFEFSPEVRQKHQHYLGLCIRPHRQDIELDPLFSQKWAEVLSQKQSGKSLVYCCFGTFYEGTDKKLLHFIKKLVEFAQTQPDVLLVCSVNKFVVAYMRMQIIPSNLLFFERVPQQQVLEVSDVFITHGGLGSIKEAIYYTVPMLVYPLNLHYDQNGNAFKVEYHGLGLRGNFNAEPVEALQEKVQQLLVNPMFSQTIKDFKTKIESQPTGIFLD